MPNAAHLHLMLVHIPVVLLPFGCLFFLLTLSQRWKTLIPCSLTFLTVAGFLAIPGFLSGEGAEEVVEHLPGVAEKLIEQHEAIADVALWLSVATGAVSLLAIFSIVRAWGEGLRRGCLLGVLLLSLSASGTLIVAANLGGRIRHPEAFPALATAGLEQMEADHDSKEKDDRD